MALMCPACKRRYEGDHVFCEDCGNSLALGRPGWRKWALLGFATLLVFGGFLICITMIENDVRNNIKVSIDGYNFDTSMSELRVPVLIRNNSSVSLRVDSVSCRATIFGKTARCVQVDYPPEIRPGEFASATLHIALVSTPEGTTGSSIEIADVSLHAWRIPIHYQVDPVTLLSLSDEKIRNFLNPFRPKDPDPPPPPANCCETGRHARRKSGSADPVTGVFHQEKDVENNGAKEARDLARKAVSKVKDMSQLGGNR